MKLKMTCLLTLWCSLLFLKGYCQLEDACQEKTQRVYLAPLWQYTYSHWSNHLSQCGNMWGVVAGYDRTKMDAFYWGGEIDYAEGKLTGSAGHDQSWECWGEGRIGYTFTFCACPCLSLTPYVGLGYYTFDQDIPHGDTFKTSLWYVPIGVRLEYALSESFKIGLRGSIGPAFDGRWKISGSEDDDHWRDAPTDVIWRVDLPLTYTLQWCGGNSSFDIALVPFVRNWTVRSKGHLIGQRNIYSGIKI